MVLVENAWSPSEGWGESYTGMAELIHDWGAAVVDSGVPSFGESVDISWVGSWVHECKTVGHIVLDVASIGSEICISSFAWSKWEEDSELV